MPALRIGVTAVIGAGILIMAGTFWLGGRQPVSAPPAAGTDLLVEEPMGNAEEGTVVKARESFQSSVRARTAEPSGARPVTQDEAKIMARLREVNLSNPPLSLTLAREGNARFPDSPDAPERAWFEARALVDMQRFTEARELAREMGRRYPGTSWTEDVERHLLTHPLGLPPREDPPSPR